MDYIFSNNIPDTEKEKDVVDKISSLVASSMIDTPSYVQIMRSDRDTRYKYLKFLFYCYCFRFFIETGC